MNERSARNALACATQKKERKGRRTKNGVLYETQVAKVARALQMASLYGVKCSSGRRRLASGTARPLKMKMRVLTCEFMRLCLYAGYMLVGCSVQKILSNHPTRNKEEQRKSVVLHSKQE